MVVAHRGDLQLLRRAQSAENRALRHLQGLDDGQCRNPGRRPQQMVRRRRGQTHAVKDVSFEAYLRRDSLRRRPLRQRQDDHAQHDLRDPAAQQRHGEDRGHRHLEPRQRRARRIPTAQDRLRVSGLSSVPAAHDRRERRDSADSAKAQLGRGAQGGGDGSRDRRLEGPGRTAAGEAERRRTAARRDRPRDRQPPGHPDSRRAHRLARRRHRPQHREVRARAHPHRQALHRHRDARQPHLRVRRPHREDGGRQDDGRREGRS